MARRTGGPVPSPTPESVPFWEHCRQHELWIQRCDDCERPFFYPRFHCPRCGSKRVSWFQTAGRGRLYSFMINHRPPPWLDGSYVIAVVELLEGPRLLGNLLDVEPFPEHLQIDMPLEVAFEDLDDGISLAQWRPVVP